MRSAHTFLLKNLLTVTINFEKVNNTSEAEQFRMWYGLNWLRIVAYCRLQHLV